MEVKQFNELRDTGLLWLINKALLHPRGYALALHYEVGEDGTMNVDNCTGWSIMGDGTEPWHYSMDPPTEEERQKYGALSQEELFQKVKELLP